MSGTSAPATRTGAKQWWGLAVLVIPSTLLFMMLTILFLAAPNLATDLNPSSAQLLWILDIYGFVMAGFLVAMGVLGDRVGKRRLMVIGAILYAVVSIAAALTTEPSLMIVWRAVLGLGGAMMLPATLGLIFVLFSDAKQRGVAIGIWAGGISAGVALGPLLSGLLLEAYGWEATFLVAVPIMAIVVIGAPLLVPEHRDPTARFDLFSALLLVASLLAIIYGIKRFATQQPAGLSIALLVVGALIGLWFVIRQLRAKQPLLDVRLFRNKTVSGALAVFLLSAAALGGVYQLFAQYLQQVQGLSPLQAGFGILPAAAVLIVASTLSGVRPEVPTRKRDRDRPAYPGRRVRPVHATRRWDRPGTGDRQFRDHLSRRGPGDGADHRFGGELGPAGEGGWRLGLGDHSERSRSLPRRRADRQCRRGCLPKSDCGHAPGWVAR